MIMDVDLAHRAPVLRKTFAGHCARLLGNRVITMDGSRRECAQARSGMREKRPSILTHFLDPEWILKFDRIECKLEIGRSIGTERNIAANFTTETCSVEYNPHVVDSRSAGGVDNRPRLP